MLYTAWIYLIPCNFFNISKYYYTVHHFCIDIVYKCSMKQHFLPYCTPQLHSHILHSHINKSLSYHIHVHVNSHHGEKSSYIMFKLKALISKSNISIYTGYSCAISLRNKIAIIKFSTAAVYTTSVHCVTMLIDNQGTQSPQTISNNCKWDYCFKN